MAFVYCDLTHFLEALAAGVKIMRIPHFKQRDIALLRGFDDATKEAQITKHSGQLAQIRSFDKPRTNSWQTSLVRELEVFCPAFQKKNPSQGPKREATTSLVVVLSLQWRLKSRASCRIFSAALSFCLTHDDLLVDLLKWRMWERDSTEEPLDA